MSNIKKFKEVKTTTAFTDLLAPKARLEVEPMMAHKAHKALKDLSEQKATQGLKEMPAQNAAQALEGFKEREKGKFCPGWSGLCAFLWWGC